MMEGISGEAASLAGHLKLASLCWIYDNNRITIEGNTALAFSDDVATRYMGHGWNVTRVGDDCDLNHIFARSKHKIAAPPPPRPPEIKHIGAVYRIKLSESSAAFR
jgi:transketolase